MHTRLTFAVLTRYPYYGILCRPCSCLQSSIHYPTVPSVGEALGSLVALERLLET